MNPRKTNVQKTDNNLSPEAQILDLQLPATVNPGAALPAQNLPPPQPLAAAPAPTSPASQRRRGRRSKLLQLPKEDFDWVNSDLENGMPYEEIISTYHLGCYGITFHTLSEWVTHGGHAEWLEQDTNRAELKHSFEDLIDLVQSAHGNKLHEAGYHLASAKISEILANLDTTTLRQKLETDPKALVQFLNSLPKLSKADIDCEKHRISMDNHRRLEEKRQLREAAERNFLMEQDRKQREAEAAAQRQAQAQAQQAAQQQPPNSPPPQPPPAQPPPPNPPQT